LIDDMGRLAMECKELTIWW